MVGTALKTVISIGMNHDDSRGKVATRKTSEREHINSNKRVESHNCGHDTNKEHLPHNLSIAEMKLHFSESCDKIKTQKVSVFNEEFNIAFHDPLKGQCYFCVSFANSSQE